MANTLKRMERDGLVRRDPDPRDGRRAHIRLTARARRLERPLTTVAREINAHAAADLAPGEVAALMQTVARLVRALEASPDDR